MIYLQNIKFVQLILWPGGVYTDDTYATKPESRSHIRIHFMNHDYIGSFWQCHMSQKVGEQLLWDYSKNFGSVSNCVKDCFQCLKQT